MIRKFVLLSLSFNLFLPPAFSQTAASHTQTDFTRIYGADDQTIPTPAFLGALGQKDAAALQELTDYLKAVNVSTWKGLQATGMLTDSSGGSSQATLTVLSGDHSRLDVHTPSGERSTRISGTYGKTLEVDGKGFFMPPVTAKVGLIAFPQLLVSTFPASNASLIDRGQVQIDGKLLHRITVEQAVFAGISSASQRNTSVIDLYFDPSTHLLLKSASSVQLVSSDSQRYLIVITYGDYQNVQGSLIPFAYSQTLNGKQQWTLQLNNTDLQPSVDTSYFQF